MIDYMTNIVNTLYMQGVNYRKLNKLVDCIWDYASGDSTALDRFNHIICYEK